MATTPPPPDAAGGDWRESVLQSYRNDEVREIAKVLAALEPGATTSSKLMLAMRFEDAIFKAATSLADYRKKLTKRLKKLQKNYVPPAPTEATAKKSDKDALLLSLKRKYGTPLRYIATNAEKAIKDVKERSGSERAEQLRQHTDSAVQWAKDLGVIEEASSSSTSKAVHMPESQLQKLEQHLERRVENIRQYVVKHADPDLFLQETLEKKDKELPARANKLLGLNLSKRIQQLQKKTNGTTNSMMDAEPELNLMSMLQESLEKAQTTVPPPTRNNSNDIPAALLHLDKMRAASTALMSYFAIPERQQTAPRNVVSKTSEIASEGAEFVLKVAQKLPKTNKDEVSLEDAWTKVIELPSLVEEPNANDTADSAGDATSSPAKRAKTDLGPPVTKSRVLLTPNRKTPSNLIPALKRKRATLIRPPHGSKGSHLILQFGKAFSMTIYFCPLVVSLRAMEASTDTTANGNGDNGKASRPQATTLSTKGCATWMPLHYGLTNRKDLKVWGVEGSYEAIGHVVEERLRDASLHATYILRKCFQNHVKDKTLDFEVEILEASALLEFLQLARNTYMPQWQDDES